MRLLKYACRIFSIVSIILIIVILFVNPFAGSVSFFHLLLIATAAISLLIICLSLSYYAENKKQ